MYGFCPKNQAWLTEQTSICRAVPGGFPSRICVTTKIPGDVAFHNDPFWKRRCFLLLLPSSTTRFPRELSRTWGLHLGTKHTLDVCSPWAGGAWTTSWSVQTQWTRVPLGVQRSWVEEKGRRHEPQQGVSYLDTLKFQGRNPKIQELQQWTWLPGWLQRYMHHDRG